MNSKQRCFSLTPTDARLVNKAMRRNVVHLGIPTQAWEAVRQIHPRADQDGSSGQRYALVSQHDEHAQHHASTGRVSRQDDGVGVVLLLEEMQIYSQACVCQITSSRTKIVTHSRAGHKETGTGAQACIWGL
jgi:hypothetical protein